MRVEVVLALAERADCVSVTLPAGATLRDALVASGLPMDLKQPAFGIFGKRAGLDHPLAEGDRVEVYRPLALDPKEARRRRALKKRRR